MPSSRKTAGDGPKIGPEQRGLAGRIRPYLSMIRADHWFKNVFVLPGAILAVFFEPQLLRLGSIPPILITLIATCLVASSNYVINELLDAPYDREHPVKWARPAARGQVKTGWGLALWAGLAVAGLSLAWGVDRTVGLAALALWIMGILYNVPPLRTKDVAYLDVISESINNPLRLLLGWFALIHHAIPPVSLAISYWMIGAFFMAIKRFAEYRQIGNGAVAGRYRRSFRHYDEDRLLVSLFFFAMMGALFTGVFIVRYQLELILAIPLVAGFLTWYMKIGLQADSPVQNPEKLYREWGFVLYAGLCVAAFVILMFTHVPLLYDLFNVELSNQSPLWTIGASSP